MLRGECQVILPSPCESSGDSSLELLPGRFAFLWGPRRVGKTHWIQHYLLTGPSARKLRQTHADLLAGRAWRCEMGPLSAPEVKGFDLERCMWTGALPPRFLSPDPERDLGVYVADCRKEEISAEARLQNVPAFAGFLRVAALTSSELRNHPNVARETGVTAKVTRAAPEPPRRPGPGRPS